MRISAARVSLQLGVSVLLAGCAATMDVVSKKAPGANPSPRRIYIQSFLVDTRMGANFGQQFADGFDARLTEDFEKCGAQVSVGVVNGLEMDNTAFLKDLETFKPDAVLRVMKSMGTVTQYGQLTRATFAVDLYDAAVKDGPAKALARGGSLKAIWRSTVEFKPGDTLIYGRYGKQAASLADKMANKMKEDGFFPGCAQIEPPASAAPSQTTAQAR